MAHVVGINERGLRVGQWHHRAKLTDTEVDKLLELYESGWGYKRLAKAFDVSPSQVRHICKGRQRQVATAFRTIDPVRR